MEFKECAKTAGFCSAGRIFEGIQQAMSEEVEQLCSELEELCQLLPGKREYGRGRSSDGKDRRDVSGRRLKEIDK